MSLNIAQIEADVEEAAAALLAAIPGNPGLLIPVESTVVKAILGFGFSYLQAKLSGTVSTSNTAISAGVSAGNAAAAASVKVSA